MTGRRRRDEVGKEGEAGVGRRRRDEAGREGKARRSGGAGARLEGRGRRGDYSSISERSDRGDSSVAAEGEPSPSPLGVQGDYSNTLEAYLAKMITQYFTH